MKEYVSPFNITNKMLDLVSDIMENIGKMDSYQNLNRMPILRKNNRIKSIHSSLAIEANTLSFEQVQDVINGKLVRGPKQEIDEVKNAYQAYEMMEYVEPFNLSDLKKVYGVMMNSLIDDAGCYRHGKEGVFDDEKCIFMAPGPEMVEELMNGLFSWLKTHQHDIHPLILSSVFHYEFVFIHPFSDGNGRMARVWQNVILGNWKDLFYYLPIESQIKKYQDEYYRVIDQCNHAGNSTLFIEFILLMIDETIQSLVTNSHPTIEVDNPYIIKLLCVMEDHPMSANEIMRKLEIKSKETFRNTYLNPAIKAGFVRLTIPDKPTSKNQMYYKL